jgi:hypothetical protein
MRLKRNISVHIRSGGLLELSLCEPVLVPIQGRMKHMRLKRNISAHIRSGSLPELSLCELFTI